MRRGLAGPACALCSWPSIAVRVSAPKTIFDVQGDFLQAEAMAGSNRTLRHEIVEVA